ncbi:type IV secretory system conjugative DNA transfer family protein, partial [Rhizobium lentis]|uniref:type IV secretory system conjugative DNA transfer family protein n=1 Tax=Rhizobium lentis TaxID=1138194 RepID=UPI002180B80B
RNIFDTNIQLSDQGAPLLRPEQVRLIDDDMEIVLIKGQPPLRLKKVKYYSDRALKRIFDSQSGALPEPEPLHLATTYVQAPATLLVAAESLPDEGKLDDAAQTALPDYDEVPVEDQAFSDFPGGGGAGSDAGGEYADVEQAHNVYEPDRVSDDHLSEEELQGLAAQRALLDRIIKLQSSRMLGNR